MANTTIYLGGNDAGDSYRSKLTKDAADPEQLKIFCFDITRLGRTAQFLTCCAGVFVLYIIYGYLQELIFTLDGFKPYGWYLTLIQFGYYTIFGFLERRVLVGGPSGGQRCIPIRTYLLLALLTLGTMGLSNSSLGYLNYPTQVIFKCCKLIPVLIGSIIIQKKQVDMGEDDLGVFD